MCQCGNDPNANYCVNCQPGDKGDPGVSLAFIIDPEPAGANCPDGGWKVQVGVDSDLDGVPDTGIYTFYVQNGAPGLAGATPTFVTGTVTTLLPGASATAAVVPIGLNQYRIDLGVPKGDQGDPGPEQLLWCNTYFVDAVNGINGTAVGGDATKPYKTIEAALLAMSAIVWTSGNKGALHIRNASYTVASTLTIPRWVDVFGDTCTIISNAVGVPAVTLLGESHIIIPGGTIANTAGGKAIYAVSFFTGKIELNKIVGAVDITSGSFFTMKVRDWLPTSTPNVPNGFGDLTSGNCTIRNATAEIECVNCWASIRVTDTGTSSVVKLRGYFKNGVWAEQNSIIETGNAEISRNNGVTTNGICFIDNSAILRTFATKIKAVTGAYIGIILNAAGTRAFTNSTVINANGGNGVMGNAAARIYNTGGTSSSGAIAVVNEVFVGTQPIFVNALVD